MLLTFSIMIVTAIAEVAVGLPTKNMFSENSLSPPNRYKFVSRSQWKARAAKQVTLLNIPVPYVVIHHSFIPPTCTSEEECSYAMRTMQSMHVDQNKWWDIGYNFGVGSDGSVYEGRGWQLLGAHALRFNNISLGICLIGNWNDTLPPEPQLAAVKALISDGVEKGFIRSDYKLVGHRQVRPTECPGQTLFEHITTWPHFDPTLDLAKNFEDNNIVPSINHKDKIVL